MIGTTDFQIWEFPPGVGECLSDPEKRASFHSAKFFVELKT